MLAPFMERETIIIGAGMSGILAAIRLGQANIPYTVIEKNSGTTSDPISSGCRHHDVACA